MAHDWLELIKDVAEGTLDFAAHADDWRVSNRLGLFFTVMAIVGLGAIIFCAISGQRQLPVLGWWILGASTVSATFAAGVSFYIGSRSED